MGKQIERLMECRLKSVTYVTLMFKQQSGQNRASLIWNKIFASMVPGLLSYTVVSLQLYAFEMNSKNIPWSIKYRHS